MEIDKLKLFKYLNNEYNLDFHIDQAGDVGQVPFSTGVLKQDAFLVYVRQQYGIVLTREDVGHDLFSKWDITVIDDKKFSWLMLKI